MQIWDRNGVQVYLSQPQRVLPQYAQLGFTTVDTDSGEWRVFSALAGEQVVQVAQPMSVRRELAASMALRTIVPLLAVAARPRRCSSGSASRAGCARSSASPPPSASARRALLEPLAGSRAAARGAAAGRTR